MFDYLPNYDRAPSDAFGFGPETTPADTFGFLSLPATAAAAIRSLYYYLLLAGESR
jgi:hypothetical protein